MNLQQQADIILINSARELAAVCQKEALPLPPQADQKVRKEMELFLALPKEAREDMLAAADEIFYGVDSPKEILRLNEMAKSGTLPMKKYEGKKVDMLLGAVQMLKGAASVSNFILNKTAFWGETQGVFPQYQMTISNPAMFAREATLDTGYLLAYNPQDARGAVGVDLEDLFYDVQFYQLLETQEVPVSGATSNEKTPIRPLRYGGGKFISQWYEGKVFGTTTAEVNQQIRMGSAAMKCKVAYQTLLRKPKLAANQFKMETLDSDNVSNIILNLNKSIQKMLNAAREAKNPLFLAPNAPILVYYHPDYWSIVKQIQNRTTSTILATTQSPDLISLDYNVVFVPTFQQSKSGAWVEVAGEVDKDFTPKMKDAGVREFGVKIIIPKQRSYMVIFQDLFPDTNINRVPFMKNYVWEERYKAHLDELVEGWLYTK